MFNGASDRRPFLCKCTTAATAVLSLSLSLCLTRNVALGISIRKAFEKLILATHLETPMTMAGCETSGSTAVGIYPEEIRNAYGVHHGRAEPMARPVHGIRPRS